jgi:AcrR family transcriptional regulator
MDNRSVLLDCALDLFASRGYDGVGVQEIVEAAGITKPTLYHYFGSKGGLLQALLEQHFTDFLVKLSAASQYKGDLPLTLTEIARTYFQYAEQDPTFYRLQLSMSFAAVDSEAYRAVVPFLVRQLALMEEMFRQAGLQHGNMQGRHKEYAATLLGMVNTYAVRTMNEHIHLDEGQIYRAVHQFQYGIYS